MTKPVVMIYNVLESVPCNCEPHISNEYSYTTGGSTLHFVAHNILLTHVCAYAYLCASILINIIAISHTQHRIADCLEPPKLSSVE